MHFKILFKSFTVIELIIVIAIIGILAAILLPRFNQARQDAFIAKAKAELAQIQRAVAILATDSNEWPGHSPIDFVQSGVSGNEVWDLNAPDAGIAATDGTYVAWKGPYINRVPLDPWGSPYFFDTDYDIDLGSGQTWVAVVGSFGPNGQGQNVYDSDDIYLIIASE